MLCAEAPLATSPVAAAKTINGFSMGIIVFAKRVQIGLI
jgi:hypothetical protein